MNIKSAIRKTNDASIYFVVIVLLLFTALVSASSGFVYAALVLIGGWLLLSFIYGLWCAISENVDSTNALIEQQKKTNYLLEKLVDKE